MSSTTKRIIERLTATRECRCSAITPNCHCLNRLSGKQTTCAECSAGWHVNVNGEPWQFEPCTDCLAKLAEITGDEV